MAKFGFILTGASIRVERVCSTPLRRVLTGMRGSKLACVGCLCDDCTVDVNYDVDRSCAYTLDSAQGGRVTTIEGLAPGRRNKLHFFFIDPPTPEIYTLSLHDALPI